MKKLIVVTLLIVIACGGDSAGTSRELFEQGVGYYMKKDLKAAERLFLECIDSKKDHHEALLVLAKIYYFQNREKEFEETIEKYLQYADGSVDGLRLQARWHLRKNDLVKAKDILNGILKRNGDDLVSLYLLGSTYYLERDFNTALLCFKRATGHYVYLKNIHMKTSEMYNQLGLPERARMNRDMCDTIDNWMKDEK